MKYTKLILILMTIFLFSCDKNKVYEKFDKDFTENRWMKSDVRVYDFTIEDATQDYDLVFSFSHVYDYQFESIPVVITVQNPDKTSVTKHLVIKIKEPDGTHVGKCDGDYCDIYETIFANKKLESGNYKVKVAHEFPGAYLPNVIGIGIKCSISKK